MRLFILLFLSVLPVIAVAEPVIRDAEIESVIKEVARPIFRVAGLNSASVNVFIYQSDDLNAFVPEGKTIFISTGLIAYSDKPEVVAGVIAHEVGHITGGHVLARKGEYENFRKRALLSSAVGIIAGLATRSPEVFLGASGIGTDVSFRQLLNYSRSQEASADQAALKYMSQIGMSNNGLVDLLSTLKAEEKINSGASMQYLRTHPVSQERINAIKNFNQEGNHTVGAVDAVLYEKYKRVVAKIKAYTQPPSLVKAQYGHEPGVAGSYALAIANLRVPNHVQALSAIEGLIAKEPDNPYFYEIKAQILLEQRKLPEALEMFRKAYSLQPKNALFKYQYASVLNLARKDAAKSISLLEGAVTAEPDFPTYWRQLGIAYGLAGDQTNSNLALAYEALLGGNSKSAKRMLAIAEKGIMNSKSKTALLRYKDIKQAIVVLDEMPGRDEIE